MFIAGETIDCGINYQLYKKKMTAAGNNADAKARVEVPKYMKYLDDVNFETMVKTLALSTTSFFAFTPDIGLLKREYAKELGVNVDKLTKTEEWETKATHAEKEGVARVEKRLRAEQENKDWVDKDVKGDASETGLLKFIAPLMLKEFGINTNKRDYPEKGLEKYRDAHPVLSNNAQKEKYEIKFSSDIKFNLMVRDMNPNEKKPRSDSDNVSVFLKGAPDRVWIRCNTILGKSNGRKLNVIKLDESRMKGLETANTLFGNMGERVLGFSRLALSSEHYSKKDLFMTKKWKEFNEIRSYGDDHRKQGWFPMWDLTFVGLVSLNDPPREGVDMSVTKCKMAGIKVIMVTGDQKNTGAAIAAKVNIITDKETEYNYLVQHGMTEEEAMENCKSIVVHGDELAEVNFAEEGMDDMEIEKGRKIMDWIRKPEVVFARTTPSQKLLIVDACQKLGEVVAVTGDGVNDSPAIKKADIGVAMGCGSEVAQNAGDMILLDDNFCSIVNGVEEGRLIFDNLKKSIAYTLSSNIPEISPFLFFIIFQVPLPLSTVLILCIDLGTDMVPAISFAYENPELDIMERYPRNAKRDHLVNAKLISFAYLQIGLVQASAGFFTYFYILHDYGIRPATTFYLALEPGYIPEPGDVYKPDALNYGNSNYMKESAKINLNWNGNKHNGIDIRLFYTGRSPDSWSECRWNEDDAVGLTFYKVSATSGAQICWTTEALRFAQGGYLVSIVCVQWSDLMICKTRALSISQQGMVNFHANAGLVFETVLVAILCYLSTGLNEALGTR